MGNTELIVNELLTYMTHYVKNSSMENIRKIVLNFYSEDEVIDAKKVLWNSTSDIGVYSERKKSENRTVAEAHLNDIIEAILKADADSTLPTFVAINVEKLPDRQPEELNLLSAINRLSNIEKKLKDHENTLSEHGIDIMYLKDGIQNKIENIQANDNKANKSTNKENESNCNNENIQVNDNNSTISDDTFERFLDEHADNKDKSSLSLSEYNKSSKSPLQEVNNSTKNENENMMYSGVTKMNLADENKKVMRDSNKTVHKNPTIVVSESDVPRSFSFYKRYDEDGFEEVESPATKRRRINDKMQNDDIRGAEPRIAYLWVSRFEKGNPMAIKKYLNDRNVKVHNVLRTSNINAKFKSFKISILKEDVNRVKSYNFWPEGIYCKYWREQKVGKNDSNTSNSRYVFHSRNHIADNSNKYRARSGSLY